MANIQIDTRAAYFDLLLQSVQQCNLCPRMSCRRKVLSVQNGSLTSKVIFIAEAPGRLGAECTGIPLYGDKTGNNFETLLGNIGWTRSSVFITNAILCNPQDSEGNNSTPERCEVANCNFYLKMLLELISPEVVVTLGARALDALNLICPHKFTLKENVAQPLRWNGTILFPLYHTSARATVHRSLIQQRSDFIALSHLVDPQNGLKAKKNKPASQPANSRCAVSSVLLDVIASVLKELNEISFFKLTKLLYLIDYHYYEHYGRTITQSVYLRMQAGPWIPYLKDVVKEYNGKLFTTRYEQKKPFVSWRQSDYTISSLDQTVIQFIADQCMHYANASDAKMRTCVYLTPPMKYILRQEQNGRKMSKIPVLYKDRTVIDADSTK